MDGESETKFEFIIPISTIWLETEQLDEVR